MGQELYTAIRDPNGKIVWESDEAEDTFFCGRHEETEVITCRMDWSAEHQEVDFTDFEMFKQLESDLQEKQDKSDNIYNKLSRRISDLYTAREHSLSIKIFDEFSDAIDCAEELAESEYWDRARDMIRLMKRTLDAAAKLAHTDIYTFNHPDLKGYHVYWMAG